MEKEPVSAENTTEVLIVGAGPTGLTMATLLRRWNISCRVIDIAEQQAHESRALGIQARTMEIFKNIGVVDKFLSSGQIADGIIAYLRGKKKIDVRFQDFGRDDTPFPYIFFLSQAETEKILADDLRSHGVEVERPLELLSFLQNKDQVIARVRGKNGKEENISCQFLVGCDGSHSRVRKELGLKFQGDAYPDDFIMADAKVNWSLPHDRLAIFLGKKSVGVFFPLHGPEVSRVLTIRNGAHSKAVADGTQETTSFPAALEEVESEFKKVTELEMSLSQPRWVTRFRVHHRAVDRYSQGRVFVAGDAAHIHSPIGAQGMNTGIQDAANLAWKLALVSKKAAANEILETYNSERWPVGQKLIGFTDRIFSFVSSENRLLIFIRNLVAPILIGAIVRSTKGRKMLFQFVSQLGIRYHESSVAKNRVTRRASRDFQENIPAGHRVPNVKLNKELELFDLLKGYQFQWLILTEKLPALSVRQAFEQEWNRSEKTEAWKTKIYWIVPSGQVAAETDDMVVVTETDEIFKRFGVTRLGAFLVRPDGYVGLRTDDLSLAFQ